MGNISNYWRLVRLTLGKLEINEVEQARSWFYKQFPDFRNVSVTSEHRAIQRRLMEMRSAEALLEPGRRMAEYCLYCFISHQLEAACRELAERFGEQGYFTKDDLFPLVLDAKGGHVLASKILQTFDPSISNLSTWTKGAIRQHRPLIDFQRDCGICCLTDWALLNDIKDRNRLEKILSPYSLTLTPLEIDSIWHLLESYYAVYREDLLQNESRKRSSFCSPTTDEQLQRIVNHLQERGYSSYTSQKVLHGLQSLAEKVRRYKTRRPLSVSIDPNTKTSVYDQSLPNQEKDESEERDEIDFLNRFWEEFPQCLDEAIEQVVSSRLPDKDPQRERFLKVYCMFYCENRNCDEIALAIRCSSRTVAELLKPKKTIKEDIRHKLLNLLCKRTQELVASSESKYIDQSRLKKLDCQLRKILEEIITPEFDQAIAELFTSKNSPKRSLINVQICYYIKRLTGELEL
ncbi:hypothetical protein FNW02_06065 [Komarekiella sp. 'clone 1']|uniref:Uncharacterized protein n=1 Tax=Komarekiella delphini-convector SJRDD-AB1 TaxID=2593771 RepID=A0AA40VQ10_9NOST|nr:hypothetical protein [Komarekiella delphini-convector]MBD6615420.1 hypothetical protein [Komarekiella delphini-convector SJRDD-AB1]